MYIYTLLYIHYTIYIYRVSVVISRLFSALRATYRPEENYENPEELHSVHSLVDSWS